MSGYGSIDSLGSRLDQYDNDMAEEESFSTDDFDEDDELEELNFDRRNPADDEQELYNY